MISLLVGFVAVALVVVAFQLSCLFAYVESKKERDEVLAADPCFAER